MEFRLTPEQEALRKEFDDFFKEAMKKAPAGWTGGLEDLFSLDEGWEFHRHMAKSLGEKGWLSFAWPKQYGGQERSILEQMLLSEVMGYYGAPGIDIFGLGMLAPTLLAAGNEEQKLEHLPPISKGELMWCQGWSEPNAGSDLAGVTTRAIREGEEYIVNGQKIWTSGAHRADWCFAVVRTDPEQSRSKGLSFILINMKSPGITVSPLRDMANNHMFNEVFFDNVHVPVKNRVGEENQGWAVTRMMMNFERSNVGAFSRSRRTAAHLAEFCNETLRDGKPLSEDPLTRHRVAQIAIEAEVGIAMSHKVAWLQHKMNIGQGRIEELITAASAVKVWGSEFEQRLAYTECQVAGFFGPVKRESKWAPLLGTPENSYQTCLGANIAAGSSEIQRNLIATQGLGLPRTW